MLTVVVFWQKKEWNEELEGLWESLDGRDDWFVIRLNEELENLSDKEQQPELLLREIALRVNAREHWRLFFVDNYCYRCTACSKIEAPERCQCCGGRWRSAPCGTRKNPFIAEEKLIDNKNKEHRKRLISLITGILNDSETRFVRPESMFVIVVRDGDYLCRQEAAVPNFNEAYWKVGAEFPFYCRYLVYDIHCLEKELFQQESFLFYSLILLLSKNELHMDQFFSGYMYRIIPEYSSQEYVRYLRTRIAEIEQELMKQQESLFIYESEEKIEEKHISAYPIILRNHQIKLVYDLENKLRAESVEKVKKTIRRDICEVYDTVPKEYEEQWKEIRRQAGEDEGENAEVYKSEEEWYENQLFGISFRKEAETIDGVKDSLEKKHILEKIEESLDEYEREENYKLDGILDYIKYSVVFLAVSCAIFCWTEKEKLTSERILLYALVCIGILLFYQGLQQCKKCMLIGKVKKQLAFAAQKQRNLEEQRRNFLRATRNTMIYWKRKQNLLDYKQELKERREEICQREKELKQEKARLDTLWTIKQETVKEIARENRSECLIGNRDAEFKIPFIKSVVFSRNEKSGERSIER